MVIKKSDLFIQKSYVASSWIDGEQTIAVENPSTEEIIGYVPSLSMDKVIEAIAAAEVAQRHFVQSTRKKRAEILQKWYDLLIKRKEDIAQIITLEQGKAIREARGEVDYAAGYLLWYSKQAMLNHDYTLPANDLFSARNVYYVPIGITAAITPWNFPLAMITRKAGAAIAAGCTMIIKPSEYTPFSCLALLKLGIDAGLPQDVIQVVTGPAKEIGEVLLSSYQIRKISFTGSTKIGKYLISNSSDSVKKLSLELGGNAPLIITEDADLDTAIKMIINGKFRNNGQSCTAVNRVLVHKNIKRKLTEKIVENIKPIKAGDGFNEDNYLGSLINSAALTRLANLVDKAVKAGAKLLVGGEKLYDKGYFYAPTVLDNVNNQMEIARQEIFGPVLTLFEFSNLEEAIAIANDTEYGLAAYICCQNARDSRYIAEHLQFGMVMINETRFSEAQVPFGGIKNSGFGREGGKEGIFEYLETKYIAKM